MKRLSSKSTVYCIDGSNLVRSSWGDSLPGDDDPDAGEFLEWLNEAAGTPVLSSSRFRVIFDGSYRNLGARRTEKIMVYFSEGEKADDLLLEQASFLRREGTRVVIVTSDKRLMDKAGGGGINCMWCAKFLYHCRAALKSESR